MSASVNTSRWSDASPSTHSSTSASYRSMSVSPSLFLTVSQAKLHTFATDLLYPSSSVPTAPKDSSELLRRGLLISNAMDAAKKQMKIERKTSYDEARYTKRNTSSRGHLRGSSRSASSSSHSTPTPIVRHHGSTATSGSVHEPNAAIALDAEEGEEWFEETWRELMDEDERDASFSNTYTSSSSSTSPITVHTEYKEYTATSGSEQVYYTNGDASKFHSEVQVLPVELEEQSPSTSPESSRTTSPVSSEGSDFSEAELIGIQYSQPVYMPSQLLGMSTFPWDEETGVSELSIGDAEPYEHADLDDSVYLVRSDASSSPLKPRLLPTIIRDKFYEPSRFETEGDEDIALASLSATSTSIVTLEDFMSMNSTEIVYGSSPTGSVSSESEDDDDLDEVRTPQEDASDEFGATGDSSLRETSSSSSFDDTSYAEHYFATGFNQVSKASFSMSDAGWETMGTDIPFFS
ncbi:hypothetical protein QFC22_000359 [Naganishia vaughanmartiniae]|uniref:Uncharacterized protein n=1 Tax=Naganishia vaughanmartiniae TaxID=1424756 RepID=A0ACC2XPV0_9TREE|nr:hypothetical protein QFC22_000359 [Naganishia vaughanmartiniae]